MRWTVNSSLQSRATELSLEGEWAKARGLKGVSSQFRPGTKLFISLPGGDVELSVDHLSGIKVADEMRQRKCRGVGEVFRLRKEGNRGGAASGDDDEAG